MSFDLYFWRENSPQEDPTDKTCDRLCNDEEPEGIALLSITLIKRTFASEFSGVDDEGNQLHWEGCGSYFEVSWPVSSKPDKTQAIFVYCGYELLKSPDTMNRIIDVANQFGCALYDPQSGERYEQPKPKIA